MRLFSVLLSSFSTLSCGDTIWCQSLPFSVMFIFLLANTYNDHPLSTTNKFLFDKIVQCIGDLRQDYVLKTVLDLPLPVDYDCAARNFKGYANLG